MKHTKKALLASMLSLLLCCSMLVGSTFAWFTDSVTSGNNKITAGNLDIELEYASASAAADGSIDDTEWKTVSTESLFDDDALWEPGHTEYIYLRIRNAGSLALKYSLAASIFADEAGNPEKTYTAMATDASGKHTTFKLSQYLVFRTIEGTDKVTDRSDLWIDDPAEETDAMGNFAAIDMSDNVLNPADSRTGESEKTFTLAVYMPTSVGNAANWAGATVAPGETAPQICLGLNLKAVQTPYEVDSFDNQYDKDAGYVYTAVSPTELSTVAKNAKEGDVIQLTGEKFDAAAINEIPNGVALQGEIDPTGQPITTVEVHETPVNLKNNSISNVKFVRADGATAGKDLLDIGDTSGKTSVSIENCIFDYSSYAGIHYPGLKLNGPGTVKGCQFKGNKGINIDKAVGEILIEDCKFENNHYDTSINCYDSSSDSHITLKNCEFTISGQMIYIGCPEVTMEGCTLNGTSVTIKSSSTWTTRNNVFAGDYNMSFEFMANNVTFTSTGDNFSSRLTSGPASLSGGGKLYLFTLSTARTGINITIDGEAPNANWVGPGSLAK